MVLGSPWLASGIQGAISTTCYTKGLQKDEKYTGRSSEKEKAKMDLSIESRGRRLRTTFSNEKSQDQLNFSP